MMKLFITFNIIILSITNHLYVNGNPFSIRQNNNLSDINFDKLLTKNDEQSSSSSKHYPTFRFDFNHVSTPYIISLWIIIVGFGKIGESSDISINSKILFINNFRISIRSHSEIIINSPRKRYADGIWNCHRVHFIGFKSFK